MPSPNSNYDQILSSTLANHSPQLVDNIFTARPLFWFLKQAGQIRMEDGGHKIVQPLIHATNSTATSYSGDDTLPTTFQEGITAAEYDWKEYAVTIAIKNIEEAKNNGPQALFNLLEAKVMQAEETVAENMDSMFFSDGTGNSGKDWNGLKNLIGTASNTVGGISGTTYSFWNPNVNSSGVTQTIALMNTGFNTASVGSDRPGFIMTTQSLYEGYEKLIQSNQRFEDPAAADAGFINLMFKTAPIVYDTYCTASYMYFVNPKYVKLVGHSENWFRPTPFVKPSNQTIRVAQIICVGNLIVSNRKRHYTYSNMTAA